MNEGGNLSSSLRKNSVSALTAEPRHIPQEGKQTEAVCCLQTLKPESCNKEDTRGMRRESP